MRLCSVAPGACPPLEPFYSFHIHFFLLMQLHSWIVAFLSLSLSLITVSEKAGPVAGSASGASDLADDDLGFMTTVSDSVLTVLNGNLWMLPGGFAVDKEERIDRFVAYARHLMPQTLAWHFSLRSMLIREPVVSDHYMLAYRIKLQQRSLAQRSQEAL